MDIYSYKWMKVGVVYNSYYELGGACLIKKAAEDVGHGFLTARFPDGQIKRRHYAFFSLMGVADIQTFNIPLK